MSFHTQKLDDIRLGERVLRTTVSLPGTGAIESAAPGECKFHFASPERSFLGLLAARSAEKLRLYILSLPHFAEAADLQALLPAAADGQAIADLASPVEAAARAGGLTLNAAFCELTPDNCFAASPEEDLPAYCTLVLSSHGFPAAVQVRGDQFFLPGRSGLPLGVVGEPQYIVQNIDVEPGDDLYFHSPLSEPGQLRELHRQLVAGTVEPALMEILGLVRLSVE